MTAGDSSHNNAMFSLSQATLFIILQYDRSSCNQRSHTPNTAHAAFVAATATAAAASGHQLNTDL